MASETKSAVLLLSGGTDSTTLAAWANKEGYKCRALYFQHGEEDELCSARAVATKWTGFELDTIDLSQPISVICGDSGATNLPSGAPIIYSLATSYTARFGIDNIFVAYIAEDNAQSQNSLHESIDQFEKMAKVCGRQNLKILTPFIEMKKADVLKLGVELGVDYAGTWSCAQPSKKGAQCKNCGPCRARHKAFTTAGISDPTVYDTKTGVKDLETAASSFITF